MFACVTRLAVCRTLAKAMFKEPVVHRGAGGLVIVKEIEFAGLSEDNLLPFFGVCHIGYIPSDGVVLGLSKFARLAKWQAKRVQNQQAFTDAICSVLEAELKPQALAVFVQAQHLHLTSHPTSMTTSQTAGAFAAATALHAPMHTALQVSWHHLAMSRGGPWWDRMTSRC
jgi:GTP cyclohydrolase IA